MEHSSDLYIPIILHMFLYKALDHLCFIYESALLIHVKCGSFHQGHLSLSWALEGRANPNPDGKFCLGISS